MVVTRLPSEILLEICRLACTDGRTGCALRCVSKSMASMVKDFYMVSVTVTGYNALSEVIAAHKAFTTSKSKPTRQMFICDCASYDANRDESDEAWNVRRTVMADKDAYLSRVEETIAEFNPHDRAKFNDYVLRDIFEHFGHTLHSLKLMLFLPHKNEILNRFLEEMHLPVLEKLDIAAPEELFGYMSVIANSNPSVYRRKPMPALRELRVNVLGYHPEQNLVGFCHLLFMKAPVLEHIIIEAYPIMGIVHGAKGTRKWVKDFVAMCTKIFSATHNKAVPVVEIVPLIGEDMHAVQAVAMKEKLMNEEIEIRHGAMITSFCETVPGYEEWKFE